MEHMPYSMQKEKVGNYQPGMEGSKSTCTVMQRQEKDIIVSHRKKRRRRRRKKTSNRYKVDGSEENAEGESDRMDDKEENMTRTRTLRLQRYVNARRPAFTLIYQSSLILHYRVNFGNPIKAIIP